jgi:hypothetical protein
VSQLTCESYADDPEPETSKNESTKPEMDKPTPAAEPEPTENLKAEDTENFNIETEPDQDTGVGHATQNGGGDYDKPIGMKDDGYV